MKEENPMQSELRRERRRQRVPDKAVCEVCGYSKPEGLIALKTPFEEHHVVGRANDPNRTLIVCRNCHAVLGERARDAGASMRPPRSPRERVLNRLRALCSLFTLAIEMCFELAEEIIRYVFGPDQTAYEPEAK